MTIKIIRLAWKCLMKVKAIKKLRNQGTLYIFEKKIGNEYKERK
jgi:hypothetical protein